MGRDDFIHAGREVTGRKTESVESFEKNEMDEEKTGFNPKSGLGPVWYQATN
jgi:hypothetical protein